MVHWVSSQLRGHRFDPELGLLYMLSFYTWSSFLQVGSSGFSGFLAKTSRLSLCGGLAKLVVDRRTVSTCMAFVSTQISLASDLAIPSLSSSFPGIGWPDQDKALTGSERISKWPWNMYCSVYSCSKYHEFTILTSLTCVLVDQAGLFSRSCIDTAVSSDLQGTSTICKYHLSVQFVPKNTTKR